MVRYTHKSAYPNTKSGSEAAKAAMNREIPQNLAFGSSLGDSGFGTRVESSAQHISDVVQQNKNIIKPTGVETRAVEHERVGLEAKVSGQNGGESASVTKGQGKTSTAGGVDDQVENLASPVNEPMEGVFEYDNAMQGIIEYGPIDDEDAMKVD